MNRSVISRPAVLMAALMAFAVMGLSNASEAKADGVSLNLSAKNVGTKVRVKVTANAKLGPARASASFGPVYIAKRGTYQKTRKIGGIWFRCRVTLSSTRASVTCTAWTYVLGKKITLRDSKSVSIQ